MKDLWKQAGLLWIALSTFAAIAAILWGGLPLLFSVGYLIGIMTLAIVFLSFFALVYVVMFAEYACKKISHGFVTRLARRTPVLRKGGARK